MNRSMDRSAVAVRREPRGTSNSPKQPEPHVVSAKSEVPLQRPNKNVESFRTALLKWYEENRRDLPWRRTRDPYVIWISEIMLQQTRVAAVLKHFRHFVEKFPTVFALAAASEDRVLAAWSGLGYYHRARRLHQCARQVVKEFKGCFPKSAESLTALPGIGRYTAAAIASIAFAEPIAVVDGNVERVLRRLRGFDLARAQVWQSAQELISPAKPGDFNQAMMELGATVCVPRTPGCGVCPVGRWCATRGELASSVSATLRRRKEVWHALEMREGHATANAHGLGERVIRLVRRPSNVSLMAGMWELPTLPPRRAGSMKKADYWRTFRHSITVTSYTVHVVRKERKARKSEHKPASASHERWIPVRQIAQIPITGLTRKILIAGGII
jgi:A/G-specific adenine glycosylase